MSEIIYVFTALLMGWGIAAVFWVVLMLLLRAIDINRVRSVSPDKPTKLPSGPAPNPPPGPEKNI